MALEIGKAWAFGESQDFVSGNKRYNVNACITIAASLPVRELVIEDMFIDYASPCKDHLRSFIEHMQMVNDADLSYPIIMNENGVIIDGRHRLAKAIIEGHETIKTVRFKSDPESCYTYTE